MGKSLSASYGREYPTPTRRSIRNVIQGATLSTIPFTVRFAGRRSKELTPQVIMGKKVARFKNAWLNSEDTGLEAILKPSKKALENQYKLKKN